MNETNKPFQKIREELLSFEKDMEELQLLKTLAQDLKNYKKMLKLKKYD